MSKKQKSKRPVNQPVNQPANQHAGKRKPHPVAPKVVEAAPPGVFKGAMLAVLLFTALLYIRALFNGLASWDDNEYILFNQMLRNFTLDGIWEIFSTFHISGNYHPFTLMTYLIEFQFVGIHPFLYHLVNILFHLLNTWLVYKLAEKLSGKELTGVLVALLFAVHPMHVESVAWISERKDLLYTLFYLLSLIVYMNYLEKGYRLKFYFGALGLFVCSLMSKSAAVTLPVLLIAVDLYMGRKVTLKSLGEKVPFLLLSLFFGILAMISQEKVVNSLPQTYTLVERFFFLTYSVAFYIVKLVAPVNLSAMHYYPNTLAEAMSWEYYASLPFLILIGLFLLKKTAFRKEILFGLAFFLISISIMIQIIPFGFAHVAERYTYVSYIGLFYIAAQAVSLTRKHQTRKLALWIFLLFAVVFSGMTFQRIGVWKDGITLFTDVIEKNPKVYHGYMIRGIIRSGTEDLEGAWQDFDRSVELNPGFTNCLRLRGYLNNRLKHFDAALRDLGQTISRDSTQADDFINRGISNDAMGNAAAAMRDYDKAISMNPMLALAYDNRGVLKAKAGDADGALADINKALELAPESAGTYSNRGNVMAMKSDFRASVENFSKAIELDPENSRDYFNRGLSLLSLADTTAACRDWKKALELGHPGASEMIGLYCK